MDMWDKICYVLIGIDISAAIHSVARNDWHGFAINICAIVAILFVCGIGNEE